MALPRELQTPSHFRTPPERTVLVFVGQILVAATFLTVQVVPLGIITRICDFGDHNTRIIVVAVRLVSETVISLIVGEGRETFEHLGLGLLVESLTQPAHGGVFAEDAGAG